MLHFPTFVAYADILLSVASVRFVAINNQINEAMEVKTVDPVLVCGIKVRTSLRNLVDQACSKADDLMAELVAQDINQAGSPIWAYSGCDGNPDTEFDLSICTPVERKGEDRNGFTFFTLGSFRCASMLHKGPWSNLSKTYETLIGEMAKEGLQVTADCREVYLCCDFEDQQKCLTEVQMEIR